MDKHDPIETNTRGSNMPPDIQQTKSDEITDALKRLADISSAYQPQGKILQSSIFVRVREGQSIRVGQNQEDDDELSSPTVSCVSFTDDDDDFSLASTQELLAHAKRRSTIETFTTDSDDISMSSINTYALKRISDLKKRLEIQENTKLELLHQCMRLETELEKVDRNVATTRMLKVENIQLREHSAKTEKNLMNEMSKISNEMKEKEEEYKKQLNERDKKIAELEEDLKLLQITKNVDPPSVITVRCKNS
jgi:hypothetical protein